MEAQKNSQIKEYQMGYHQRQPKISMADYVIVNGCVERLKGDIGKKVAQLVNKEYLK
jgi:hypothetical protein